MYFSRFLNMLAAAHRARCIGVARAVGRVGMGRVYGACGGPVWGSSTRLGSFSGDSRGLAFDFGPGIPLNMPALSPTMTTGSVVAWHVEEGTELEPGQVLCDIGTDKATVGFENQDDGVLAKILVPAGTEDIPVGVPLAVMVEDAADLKTVQGMDFSGLSLESVGGGGDGGGSKASEVSASSDGGSKVHAKGNFGAKRLTPSARHLVESYGVDVSDVNGTGKHGMVTKGDVLVAMGRVSSSGVEQVPSSSVGEVQSVGGGGGEEDNFQEMDHGGVVERDDKALERMWLEAVDRRAETRPGGVEGKYTDARPSMMRKVIASRLADSKVQNPHMYATMECKLDGALALRKRLKEAGVNVSVNDLVVQIAAHALRAVPEANAQFNPSTGSIDRKDTVDVSVAVATEGGLITPIVKNADSIGLAAINATTKELAARARKGALAPEEYQGGTFTVSNLGMFGIDEFTAVLNPPQACILAVGQGSQRVVLKPQVLQQRVNAPDQHHASLPVGDDDVTVETVMTVQLSADRRVVDEAIAGQFLNVFRRICENPDLLLAPTPATRN